MDQIEPIIQSVMPHYRPSLSQGTFLAPLEALDIPVHHAANTRELDVRTTTIDSESVTVDAKILR